MFQGQSHSTTMNQVPTNSASRGNHGGCGKSHGGRGNQVLSSSNGGRGQYQHNSGGGHRPTCQVYGKAEHVALKCYHRFNHSYQTEDNRVVAAATTQSYAMDANWYTNTRAMNHITSDLDQLTIKERYIGKHQVQAANGASMLIAHIGH